MTWTEETASIDIGTMSTFYTFFTKDALYSVGEGLVYNAENSLSEHFHFQRTFSPSGRQSQRCARDLSNLL